jgi:hypothetical protein
MAGTREDALLVVELAKYAAMLGIADATGKVFGDEFDPERAERGDPVVSRRARLQRSSRCGAG